MANQILITPPDVLKGRVVLPSSKSISNRALVINRLAGSSDAPRNVSDCDDTRVMLEWLGGNGGDGACRTIDIGAAGTAMRFSTALLAVSDGESVITGTERMKNRPIGVLVEALRKLGARVEYVDKEGFPPLRITGDSHLEGGQLSLPGNVSSQYVSALLMIAPVLQKGLRLTLTGDVVSRPYIDMTLGIMRDYGAECGWEADNVVAVRPTHYIYKEYLVESDWSAASYWYEMVALAPNADAEVVLPGLFADSLQGDSHGAALFEKLGVSTEFKGNDVIIRKIPQAFLSTRSSQSTRSSRSSQSSRSSLSSQISRNSQSLLTFDFVEMPDLAQTFVVTCCMKQVPFHFTGLQSLKIKETDRIVALQTELAKLGYDIESRNDSELLWHGTRREVAADELAQVAIDTYEDHRMAMAFAPAAMRLGGIRINDPHVVSKSYPGFWSDLRSAGFRIAP